MCLHQKCISVPIALHLAPHLLLLVFFISAPYCGAASNIVWYLILILICISFMANNVEHFFMCLFTVHIQCFVKCLFKSCARLFFFFLSLSSESYLYVLNINPLVEMCFASIFSHSFHFLYGAFQTAEVFCFVS